MTDTYGDRRGVAEQFQEALRAELNTAYDNGGEDMARHILMRLNTVQVNAHNERLSAEDFRDVAAGILDELVAELQNLGRLTSNNN